jgi:arginyl-tRNA synthetase
MSTRKGDIVFLEDVLNEAKERAIESCKTSPSEWSNLWYQSYPLNELLTQISNYLCRILDTKISEDNFDSVADILGISGLLVHDMSYRRVQDYRFNWDKALRHTGDTGIALQYTHARLCRSPLPSSLQMCIHLWFLWKWNPSLETNCGVDIDLDFEPNVDALSDFEAKLLINRLSQFDEILIASYESLDPSLLVHYLFDLRQSFSKHTSKMC